MEVVDENGSEGIVVESVRDEKDRKDRRTTYRRGERIASKPSEQGQPDVRSVLQTQSEHYSGQMGLEIGVVRYG